MQSLNKVQLIGHIGQDCETKYTPGGNARTTFSLATGRKWKDKASGELKEATDWHNIVVWQAENLAQYLLKGKLIYVEGRIENQQYEGRDGVKKYYTSIVSERVILLSGAEKKPAAGAKPVDAAVDAFQGQGISDDDVPF